MTIKAPYCLINNARDNDDTKTRYAYVALTRCNDPKNVTIVGSMDCGDVNNYCKTEHTCQNMPLSQFYTDEEEPTEKRILIKKPELEVYNTS